ncbi:unnamed protein product [Paramecium sonneborni]|uniref:Uncharacterized protein n=1 Tax=Paramecium sonneborni TaxID=65129 RepID=A0A8S1R4T5_9CILI|nr:unnamed protein product [Paramecium sonneborni]
MIHILYTYFNHFIIQSLLKSICALNPIEKIILQEILEKEYFRTLIAIDLNDRQGIIPCLSLIQLYVYKFLDVKDKQPNKLVLLAQQLFQIAHLQMLINKLNGQQTNYKDDYICKYLKSGLKQELLGYFGCTKQNIEIQILKYYNNKN